MKDESGKLKTRNPHHISVYVCESYPVGLTIGSVVRTGTAARAAEQHIAATGMGAFRRIQRPLNTNKR
jgi:hypothetical protein